MGLTNKSEEEYHLKPTNSEVPDVQDQFHQSEEPDWQTRSFSIPVQLLTLWSFLLPLQESLLRNGVQWLPKQAADCNYEGCWCPLEEFSGIAEAQPEWKIFCSAHLRDPMKTES